MHAAFVRVCSLRHHPWWILRDHMVIRHGAVVVVFSHIPTELARACCHYVQLATVRACSHNSIVVERLRPYDKSTHRFMRAAVVCVC